MILPHVARFLLWLGGWTVVGEKPSVRKAVLIASPHTSNWDGFWAIVYKVYAGLDIKWFVKDSLKYVPHNSFSSFLRLRVERPWLRRCRAWIRLLLWSRMS